MPAKGVYDNEVMKKGEMLEEGLMFSVVVPPDSQQVSITCRENRHTEMNPSVALIYVFVFKIKKNQIVADCAATSDASGPSPLSHCNLQVPRLQDVCQCAV